MALAFLSSYLCIAADPASDLCLGISDGGLTPNTTLPAQLKSRLSNQASGEDFYKLRYNINDTTGTICVAANPALCLARGTRMQTGVFGLNAELDGVPSRFNVTAFFVDVGATASLVDTSTSLCATVMECVAATKPDAATQTFCKPLSSGAKPASSFAVMWRGAPLAMMPCSSALAQAQTWRQALDCAPGCSPFQQRAPKPCIAACANDACAWQDGACTTESPTLRPSLAPTLPTTSPSAGPSWAPSSTPSAHPSHAPSRSPSRTPSTSPTADPSTAPSHAPSQAPSASPSRAPTTSGPTRAPSNATAVVDPTSGGSGASLMLLLLLLLLIPLCCCCVFLALAAWRRRRRRNTQAPPPPPPARERAQVPPAEEEHRFVFVELGADSDHSPTPPRLATPPPSPPLPPPPPPARTPSPSRTPSPAQKRMRMDAMDEQPEPPLRVDPEMQVEAVAEAPPQSPTYVRHLAVHKEMKTLWKTGWDHGDKNYLATHKPLTKTSAQPSHMHLSYEERREMARNESALSHT